MAASHFPLPISCENTSIRFLFFLSYFSGYAKGRETVQLWRWVRYLMDDLTRRITACFCSPLLIRLTMMSSSFVSISHLPLLVLLCTYTFIMYLVSHFYYHFLYLLIFAIVSSCCPFNHFFFYNVSLNSILFSY